MKVCCRIQKFQSVLGLLATIACMVSVEGNKVCDLVAYMIKETSDLLQEETSSSSTIPPYSSIILYIIAPFCNSSSYDAYCFLSILPLIGNEVCVKYDCQKINIIFCLL